MNPQLHFRKITILRFVLAGLLCFSALLLICYAALAEGHRRGAKDSGNNGTDRLSSGAQIADSVTPPGTSDEERERFFKERAYPADSIPVGAAEKAWRDSMRAAAIPTVDHWTNIGPAPIANGLIEGGNANLSGRIMDIAVDPTPSLAATHWFIAADTGGIWETTDGGGSWAPRTDGEISLLMSTVTITPSQPQIVFASTRDATGSLLKSTNGGAAWTVAHSFPNSGGYFWYSAVRVDPTNSNTVVAMTWEGTYGQVTSGVQKSTDGGSTFVNKLLGAGTALQVNPTNFKQQYAAIRNSFGDAQYNGIYRSLSAGDTWTLINGPWNTIVPGGGVRIAIAPSNPSTVYVVVPGSGIWKTQNAWNSPSPPTWTAVPPAPGGFTAADVAMVDPTDPSVLYIGGGGIYAFYRLNANGTWTHIVNTTHVDQHAMAWTNTAGGSTLLLGNDGGFWTSFNRGTSWANKNSNLSTIQFVAGSLHPTDASKALGGSQDNGTEQWTGSPVWNQKDYGDGSYDAFSRTDPDHYWLIRNNVQFLKVFIDPNGVLTRCDGAPPVTAAEIRRSPNNNDVLAGSVVSGGSATLWKSTDFFDPPCAAHPTWTNNGPTMTNEISAIAFASPDIGLHAQTYAFGAGPDLRFTTNGGTSWKDLDPNGAVPNRIVTAIALRPNDPATIYVALTGYNANTPGHPGHIFKTTNANANPPTWTDVSPPADVPMNSLAIDPASTDTVYAGSDLGVWKSTNGGTSWIFMGPAQGMPNAIVNDLHFSPADGRLVAFTYGRGAFKLNVP